MPRAANRISLTVDQIRERLSYEPATGIFRWLVPYRGKDIGKEAGWEDHGYVRIELCRTTHAAHRLAWLHTYGEWPIGQIDHINGIRSDNRIVNLRDVSHSINAQNQRSSHSHNCTGILGVSFHKRDNRWVAGISVNGKRLHLGNFRTPEAASTAYLSAKRLHHEGCTL